jgi:hypothetical protein
MVVPTKLNSELQSEYTRNDKTFPSNRDFPAAVAVLHQASVAVGQ